MKISTLIKKSRLIYINRNFSYTEYKNVYTAYFNLQIFNFGTFSFCVVKGS